MIEPIAGMEPGLPIYVAPPEVPVAEPSSEADTNGRKEFKLFGEKGFSFLDLLDVINPLQHIPIISTIYRKITGDELSPGARIAGATLFGGPIGAAIAMMDTAIEHRTGHDMGGNVMVALIGDDNPVPAGGATAVAAAESPALGFARGFVGASGGAASGAYVAATLPDLGALNGFATASGAAGARLPDPIKLEPRFAVAPWQPPAAEQAEAAAAIVAQTNDQAMALQIRSKPAQTRVSQATVEAAMLQVEAMRNTQNTLAASETKDDAGASASAAEPQGAWRRVKPPASDIPKGAGAGLSRNATRAYAKSMATAAPIPAPANANISPDSSKAAAAAQNDWIIQSMATAMAKYEAGHRLQSGNVQPMQAVSR